MADGIGSQADVVDTAGQGGDRRRSPGECRPQGPRPHEERADRASSSRPSRCTTSTPTGRADHSGTGDVHARQDVGHRDAARRTSGTQASFKLLGRRRTSSSTPDAQSGTGKLPRESMTLTFNRVNNALLFDEQARIDARRRTLIAADRATLYMTPDDEQFRVDRAARARAVSRRSPASSRNARHAGRRTSTWPFTTARRCCSARCSTGRRRWCIDGRGTAAVDFGQRVDRDHRAGRADADPPGRHRDRWSSRLPAHERTRPSARSRRRTLVRAAATTRRA